MQEGYAEGGYRKDCIAQQGGTARAHLVDEMRSLPRLYICVCVCVFMDSWLSRTRMGLSTRVTFYFAAAFLCHLPARILSQGMCHVHCVRTYILLGILWRQRSYDNFDCSVHERAWDCHVAGAGPGNFDCSVHERAWDCHVARAGLLLTWPNLARHTR